MTGRLAGKVAVVTGGSRGLGAAIGQACDVGSRTEVDALRQLALDTYGRLDIWVNNAGESGDFGPTADVPEERFERVVRTNVLGVYHGTMSALEVMRPAGSGHLVNLFGRGDKSPVPFQTAYGASKSWIRAFTGCRSSTPCGVCRPMWPRSRPSASSSAPRSSTSPSASRRSWVARSRTRRRSF